MSLSKNQAKFLRSKAHGLKPVVMIGQKGLTDAVLKEIDNALDHHELIKLKLSVDDRDARKQLADQICHHCKAEEVQSIGKTSTVYRANLKRPVIQLPKE